MSIRTTPNGAFLVASRNRHSISIPYFINFREDNGRIVADGGWKKAQLSPEDFSIHQKDNVFGPLRIVHNGPAPTTYPYEFEHYADMPQGKRFTVTKEKLELWLDKVSERPVNAGNEILRQVLCDASEYAGVKARALGVGVPRAATAPAPMRSPEIIFEI